MDLKEEVLTYKISENQLKDYSNNAVEKYTKGKNKINQTYFPNLYGMLTIILLILILLTISIIDANTDALFIQIVFLFAISTVITFLLCRFVLLRLKQQKKQLYQTYKRYFEIEKNVNDFNFTIDEIEALLNSPQASKKLPNGQKILEVLGIIRGDLVSALKLEKLYRENPNHKSDRNLNVDLTSDDHFIELINRNDIQGGEMNELLTKWQEIREAINNM